MGYKKLKLLMYIKLPIVNGQQWVIHTKALKTI